MKSNTQRIIFFSQNISRNNNLSYSTHSMLLELPLIKFHQQLEPNQVPLNANLEKQIVCFASKTITENLKIQGNILNRQRKRNLKQQKAIIILRITVSLGVLILLKNPNKPRKNSNLKVIHLNKGRSSTMKTKKMKM